MKGLEHIVNTAKTEDKRDLLKIVLLGLIPLLLISFGLFANLEKGITSYTTITQETSYTDDIYKVFNQTTDHTWLLENNGELKSVKLTGSLSRDAVARIYIENNANRYLIFDSNRLEESGLGGITGLVVLNETITNETEPIINETINETTIINESTETIINKTETIINETEPIIEKIILLNLNYEENSDYDKDNDGIETLTGIIDFNVNAGFSWDVSYDKLCTKWDVYNIEDESSTIVCYGSSDCCSLMDLAPEKESWNETFYLNYGRYGAANNNIIAAQLIYADYSLELENLYSDIAYSDYSQLTAKFLPTEIDFNDICIDTCLLSGFDSDSYKLIIEISNGTISLDTINYKIIEEVIVPNITEKNITKEETITKKGRVTIGKPVKWTKNVRLSEISNVTVKVPEHANIVNINKVKDGIKEEIINVNIKKKGPKTFAITEAEPIDTTEVIIEDGVEEIEIEYETPGPEAAEQELSKHKKRITISSGIHYEDILAYTSLPIEVSKESIKLHWIVNGSKQLISFDSYDTNNNALIDYIEWNVPSLSNQTYELTITILNVQSYPTVGGNWVVRFNTTGTGDLTIKTADGTTWSNVNEENDLRFSEIACGSDVLDYEWIDNSVFIENYNCSSLGYHTVKVLTAGIHSQEFNFSGIIAYANNLALVNGSNANLTIWDTTDTELNNVSTPIYFYANYTNISTRLSINGSNINCTFSENTTGSWSPPVNITFNNTLALYTYNKSFAKVNVSYFNISCIDILGNNSNLSAVDRFQVGWANITITLSANLTTNGTNVSIYGHINLSDGSNATQSDISIYLNKTKLYYDSTARLLVTSGALTSPETDSYGNYNYTFKSPGSDGEFEITVNLTYSGIYATLNANITVDAIKPTINLTVPIDNFNTTAYNISFNWTATDNIDRNLTCNLTINSEVNASNIESDNGTMVNVTVNGINEGTYLWNVTCIDNATNTNTSETRTFTRDITGPVINLGLPLNDTWQKVSNVTFEYTATDARGIDNCILYGNFNGSWLANLTDTSVSSGVQDTFRLNLTNGTYLWNVWCNDTLGNSAFNESNFTVGVDTVLPNASYDANTAANNSFFNRTWIFISIDGNDTNEANVTFMLVNSTAVVNETTLLEDTNRTFNFTNLNSNEKYLYNVTIRDKAWNENTTETRTITLDSTVPGIALIYPANNSWTNLRNVTFNYTLTEDNPDNCWLYINVSDNWLSVVNDTNAVSGDNNFTMNLSDGNYIWNVWCNDSGGFSAFNESNFTVGVDTVLPNASYDANTAANNSFFNRTWIFISIDGNDTNEANVTFMLVNSTAVVNETTLLEDTNRTFNFTNLNSNEKYLYNVTIRDKAWNENTTETRTITLDSTVPGIALIYPANNSWTNLRNVTFNYTLTEDNPDNCWLYINVSDNWLSVVNNTDVVSGDNNFTMNLSDGNYIWNVWCNDSAGFSAFNESNFTLYVDTITPNITNENRTPPVVYYNSTLKLNATIVDDRNLSVVWIGGNWSGAWTNYYNVSVIGTGYNFTVNASEISNQEVIGWRFYANDSAGNLNDSYLQTFKVSNLGLPDTPNLTSPANGSTVVFDSIKFEWTRPSDPDNDNLTYEILVSKNITFTDIEANITNINNTELYNTTGPLFNLSWGIRYWKVRAMDPVNYSNYSQYWQITVIESVLNITNPLNNSIFYPGNTTNITIKEVKRGAWVNNVTLEILSTNYTAANNTEWSYIYTFPGSSPDIINITAIGFNITANETVTDTIQVRLSKVNASKPVINSVCSNTTYAYNNTNTKITIKSSMDTLPETANMTLVTPSGDYVELNLTSSSKNNLTYTYYYEYNITETGNYSLIANITDIENQNATLNYTFAAYSSDTALRAINLSTTGISSIKLLDVCGKNTLYNGTTGINQTIITGAKYDVRFETSDPVITFENVELNGNYTNALSYADLSKSIAAPGGKRAMLEFEVTSNITNQKNITIAYNYTSIESALDDEDGLVMYKCESQDSCSWASVDITLDTNNNVITGKTGNLSVFLIAETATTTQTVTSTVISSAGGGGGAATIRNLTLPVGLELVSEEPFQMYTNDKMTINIIAKNTGKASLYNTKLKAKSNSSNVAVTLESDFIEKLSKNEEKEVTLLLTSNRVEGKYKISVTAEVERPELNASTEIYFDIMSKGYINRTVILTRIEFAKDLFKENPECLELEEVLKNAEDALEKENFAEAAKLMDSAVQSCRDLISSKEKRFDWLPSPLRGISINEWLILSIEILVILVILILAVRYYRRKKLMMI